MRFLLTAFMLWSFSLTTLAQDNVNLKEMVGFGCYYEGRPTKAVVKVTRLVKAKDYKAISKLLTSGHSGEKFLAIISLQRLVETGEYKLNEQEKKSIEKAKQSGEQVSVCSGCTYFEKVPMKTILATENFIGSTHWLDRITNTNKIKTRSEAAILQRGH